MTRTAQIAWIAAACALVLAACTAPAGNAHAPQTGRNTWSDGGSGGGGGGGGGY